MKNKTRKETAFLDPLDDTHSLSILMFSLSLFFLWAGDPVGDFDFFVQYFIFLASPTYCSSSTSSNEVGICQLVAKTQ